MKVVSLKIPISQSIFSTAKFAVEDGLARSEEEFLARVALKGIFSDFFEDRQLRLDLSGYLDAAVKNVYTEELAGETRQAAKAGPLRMCGCNMPEQEGGRMNTPCIGQSGRGIRAGVENEAACLPLETPEQEELRFIQELCRIKGELGRTGRYGVFFALTGSEIEFWVEEFGKPGFLLYIKHQDTGTVLDYVRKKCEELNLLSTP